MRGLETLQATDAGRRLLEREMIFDEPEPFLPAVRDCAGRDDATRGPSPRWPVYAHQQVYLDYRGSVVAKITALRALQELATEIRPDFLWIDTDRSGSDKLSLRLYLAGQHDGVPVRFAPAGCEQSEPRFIPTDPVRLKQAFDRAANIIRSEPGTARNRLLRFEQLRPLFATDGTLADLSRRLTDFILDHTLAFRPEPVLVSALIAAGELARPLDTILNRLPDFIAAFNARIRDLQACDIDAKVGPLAADYLPLFMTSPEDGRRMRLKHVRDGKTSLACALRADGTLLRHELGDSHLSIRHLEGQVRWSPDVTLPILVNDLYRGMVAGRSSALYMLVMADVMRKVLGMRPIPIFVPPSFDVFSGSRDSLLNAYLDARAV